MRFVHTLLITGALVLTMGACASTPSPCDLARPAGACEVSIEFQRGNFKACSNANAVPPVCMSAVIDVTTSRGNTTRKVMLSPGQCSTLGSGIASAAQSSCSAFAVRGDSATVAAGQ